MWKAEFLVGYTHCGQMSVPALRKDGDMWEV